ncbi:3-coathanger stack domain-containing protein [Emticicia agri]|uniref:Uncharacterized protein n=1 Tax=Emticicia agri TaxID=2492393 RepID=A0A4Q5LW95_9BACT|nr:3-coathanger stack domain-containing protein [Emticicia agri]RYU93978.1 hypothetical protein EWM59_19050 [Emticicia agri]
MLSHRTIALALILVICFDCFSQNIRNNIIIDANTNPASANILDMMDFNGKTYLLIADVTEEVPVEYRSYKKLQLATIDHTTNQFTIIKEERITLPDQTIEGKFYPTNSNYFYFTTRNYFITDVWYSDGTNANTQKKTSFEPVAGIVGVLKNNCYFFKRVDDELNFEIRKITANSTPVVVATEQYINETFAYAGKDKIYFATYTFDGDTDLTIKSLDTDGNIVACHTFPESSIYAIGEVNSKFIYAGRGIFATDGTAVGTTSLYSSPATVCCQLTAHLVKSKLFFTAYGKFFVTDGTAANTQNSANGAEEILTLSSGDDAFYTKGKYSSYPQLWKTNGTTHIKLHDSLSVKNFAVSPDSNTVYFASNTEKIWQYNKNTLAFTKLNVDFFAINRLKFIGNDLFVHGELKNSTEATQLYIYKNNAFSVYKYLNTNTQGDNIGLIKVVDKYLFYGLSRRLGGASLAVTQGVPENTTIIPVNLSAGVSGDYIMKNDSVFYNFNNREIGEINIKARTYTTKTPYISNFSAWETVKINQHLVSIYQDELVEYKPISNSLTVIKSFPEYTDIDYYAHIVYQDRLYFFAESPNAFELWISDGTSIGTRLVKTFTKTEYGFNDVLKFYIVNNKLVFHIILDTIYSLWKTDGTDAGTLLIAELPSDPDMYYKNSPMGMISDGKNLYFSIYKVINETSDVGLYRTNNALTGIDYLASAPNINPAENFCSCANSIYFFTIYPTQLWKYDVATSTLTKAADFPEQGYYQNPVCLGNTLWIPMVESMPDARYFIHVLNLETGHSKRISQPKLIAHSPPPRAHENSIIPFHNSVVYRRDDYKYGEEMFIAGLCEDTNIRNNVSLTGSYYHTDAVTSREKVVIPTAISLFSAKNITLLPGFEAKNGSSFYANIKQCK